MSSEIACCRACGSHNVELIPSSRPTEQGHRLAVVNYHCRTCGHITPERESLRDAAEDVDWCPSQDVRVR